MREMRECSRRRLTKSYRLTSPWSKYRPLPKSNGKRWCTISSYVNVQAFPQRIQRFPILTRSLRGGTTFGVWTNAEPSAPSVLISLPPRSTTVYRSSLAEVVWYLGTAAPWVFQGEPRSLEGDRISKTLSTRGSNTEESITAEHGTYLPGWVGGWRHFDVFLGSKSQNSPRR